MCDYAEMRRALRVLDERHGSLDGTPCPKSGCFGTLCRRNGEVVCDRGRDHSSLIPEFHTTGRLHVGNS